MEISCAILLLFLSVVNAYPQRENVNKNCPALSSEIVKSLNCGAQFTQLTGLAHNSNKNESIVKKGEFPWSAVLMRKNKSTWKYLCGGTLINHDTVLTAAGCIQKKGSVRPKKAENIKIILGVYNISDPAEHCRKEFEVETIVVHDGWNPENGFTNDHDIALLKLKNKIEEFNRMIFPICVLNSPEISRIATGIVVGYGEFSEERGLLSDVPVKVNLPEIDFKTAILKERKLANYAWEESFIAGSETAGVCPGDSGSGFYVKSNGKFYLRGLVSSAAYDADYNCTHNNFALYTDVLKYLDDFVLKFSRVKLITLDSDCKKSDSGEMNCYVWLQSNKTCTDEPVGIKLNGSWNGDHVNELIAKMDSESEVSCLPHFFDIENLKKLEIWGYDYRFESKLIVSDSVLQSLRNLKKLDFLKIAFESIQSFLTKSFLIEDLSIEYGKIDNLPVELLKNLPMLKKLYIGYNRVETIPENIFRHNSDLEEIVLYHNKIAVLPQNLLKNLLKLKRFDVSINKITSIPDNFFLHNKQLEDIDLHDNPIKFIPENIFEDLTALKKLKVVLNNVHNVTISEDFLEKKIQLEEVYLECRELTFLPANLLKSNRKLRKVTVHSKMITSIPENIFSFNREIEEIKIWGTKITNLPEKLLKNLEKLKKVDFGWNQISSIPENFFSDNAKLEEIDFRFNQISELPRTLFKGLSGSLKKFILYNNKLKSIPHEIFFTENAELRQKIDLGLDLLTIASYLNVKI